MEIKQIGYDKFSFIIFENVYDQESLDLIWQEADFLCHSHKLQNPETTGSALDEYGRPKKLNKGIWLSNLYNSDVSNYLKLYRNIVNVMNDNREEFVKNDINLKLFFHCNSDGTLLSYYENGDYYDSHHDISCYTLVYWLFKEPKRFQGGDLIFTEIDSRISVKNNMAVLFPSWIDHKVEEIVMPGNIKKFKSNGRFCFTTFFSIGY